MERKTKESQLRAIRKYQEKNERVNVLFPPGTNERIKRACKEKEYDAVTTFIKEAVFKALEMEEKS